MTGGCDGIRALDVRLGGGPAGVRSGERKAPARDGGRERMKGRLNRQGGRNSYSVNG